MKLSVNRAELADALNTVSSVIAARSPKEILKCLLIEANEDFGTISATDLEIGVRATVAQVEVESPGATVLPADKLAQIVRESGDEVLRIEADGDTCHIRGADSHFQIFTHLAEEFPPIEQEGGKPDFALKVSECRRLAEWTMFAAARENTRYAINGVLWEKTGAQLTLVATDGRRLSKATATVDKKGEDREGIVPIKAMQVMARVLADPDSEVGVRMTSNQVFLSAPRARMSAALLEGHFPDYAQVIPADCDKTVEFVRDELLSAVRRASLLSNEESRGIRLAFDKGKLTLSSRTPEEGEATITLPVTYKGPAMEIGFNPAYLIDALKAVAGDRVTLEFKESKRPGVIMDGGQRLYVVMPVNL